MGANWQNHVSIGAAQWYKLAFLWLKLNHFLPSTADFFCCGGGGILTICVSFSFSCVSSLRGLSPPGQYGLYEAHIDLT